MQGRAVGRRARVKSVPRAGALRASVSSTGVSGNQPHSSMMPPCQISALLDRVWLPRPEGLFTFCVGAIPDDAVRLVGFVGNGDRRRAVMADTHVGAGRLGQSTQDDAGEAGAG